MGDENGKGRQANDARMAEAVFEPARALQVVKPLAQLQLHGVCRCALVPRGVQQKLTRGTVRRTGDGATSEVGPARMVSGRTAPVPQSWWLVLHNSGERVLGDDAADAKGGCED